MKRIFILLLFLSEENLAKKTQNGPQKRATTKKSAEKKMMKVRPTVFSKSYKEKKSARLSKKAASPELTKKDLKLEKSNRLQAKMALRYEKALRKSVKMERKLMKKQGRENQRSIYPTMAKQVDFSLKSPAPYLQV